MSDSVGNTLNDARSIFIGTTTQQFRETVEFGDQDYYRFTLTRASSFNLELSGLGANADVEVLNSLGNPVTVNTVLLRSTNEGTLPDTINTILDAGTYFIRVFPGPPADPNNAPSTTPSTDYTLNLAVDNGVRNDILWRYYGAGIGVNAIWQLDGTSIEGVLPLLSVPDPGWVVGGAGDFNGDGVTDLLWRYYGSIAGASGTNALWLLDNNGSITSVVVLAPETDLNWQIRGVSDFDGGQGKPDIFWQNIATGQIRAWFLDSSYSVTAAPVLSPSFTANQFYVDALGDFNQDGNTDLILRRDTDPAFTTIAFSTGGFNFGTAQDFIIQPDANQKIEGAGDFNGDGSPDLLWRNYVTGANEIWLMQGVSLSSVVPLPTVPDPFWVPFTPYSRIEPIARLDLAGATNVFQIGLLNGNGVYRDEITPTDPDDYYRFTLGSPTRLSLALNGLGSNALQANLDVQILNSSGVLVAEGRNTGNVPEQLTNLNLNPGTYSIRVFAGDNGATSSYDLELTVNNLPVLASSGPLTINEGATRTLSSTSLLVTDENDPPARLVYTLVTPPVLANGRLLSNGQALVANSTFTQADINAGRLTYVHSGSETVQDTFVFAVADGRGGTVPNTTFTVNVTPVNDPPVLLSLNPIAVSEGNLVTLSNTSLLVTDVEQGPAELTYSINSLPVNGTLSLLTGSSIGPLTLGSRFTQADINSGRLGYRQNGSETLTDSFTFTATDGAGGFLNPQVQTLSFNITPVNDPPVLVTNVPLTVSQAGPNVITTAFLRATDAELLTPAEQDRIIFSVTQLPTQGTLFLGGTAINAPFTFSQADLNAGALSYAQSGTPVNSDRFNFVLSDGIATVPPTGEFTYEIFVQRVAGPPVLATKATLSASEGVSTTISNTFLQVTDPDSAPPFITYSLASIPTVGSVLKSGTALTVGQTFSQADIDQGRIAYQQNGSEQPPFSDAFTFTFKDERGQGPITTQTFSISIIPVNDLPTILTPNALVTVTEGSGVDINSTVLNTTDPDNLAQQLTYQVISAPTNGTLVRSGTAVSTFTQADINAGQIRYLQNGSESTADSFTFDVTDLSGTLVGPGTVNISVIPFNDPPGLASFNPINLDEGASFTFSDTQLLLTDVDGPGPLTYTVGNLPLNGVIQVGNVTLSAGGTFTQADITSGRVTYIHNGSETLSDRFTFTASDGATSGLGAPGLLSLRTFSITVNPVNDAPIITVPTASASTVSVDEDVTFTFNGLNRVSVTDVDGGPNFSANFSTSNGGTINLSATPGLSGNGTSNVTYTGGLNGLNTALNNFRYRGVQDFNGNELLTISVSDGNGGLDTKTITINVIAVNDAPTLTVPTGTITVNEDLPTTALNLTVNDVDADINPLKVTLTAPNGSLTVNDTGSLLFQNGAVNGGSSVIFTGTLTDIQTALSGLVYQGKPDYNGSDRIIVTVDDQGATGKPGPLSVTRTISLNVLSVNDKPTFVGGADQFVVEDSGQQVIQNWASNISRGAANEANQSIGFAITSSDPTLLSNLFTAVPSINPATGALTFTPRADANGTIQLTAVLRDNGGTANGGIDVSDPYIFTIAVGQKNDVPTFVRGQNVTVNEDPDPTNGNTVVINNWATNIRPGPLTPAANEVTQVLNFLVDTSNPALFAVAPTVTISGTPGNQVGALTFATNPDANGTAVVTVRLQDDGGTAFGGQDTSPPQTFTIVVRPVNDAPTFTPLVTTSIDVLEDAAVQTVQLASDILPGPANESSQTVSFLLSNSNPNLFATTGGGVTPTIDPGTGILTFKPAANLFGSAVITATLRDNGGTTNGGVNSSVPYVFTINVLPVNDAPSFNRGANQTINEDAPAQSITNWATGITPGPNETGQVVNFQVTNDNNSLFSVQPTLSPTGTLTYTAAPNAFGTAIVTVALQDNGGTDNGGIDVSASQTFTITVNPVNDAPTLTLPTAQTTAEDTPINFTGAIGILFTDIDSGNNPIDVTLTVSNGTILLPSTNGLSVSAGANGSNTVTFRGTVTDLLSAIASVVYTPRLNFNGSDTLRVNVNDRGFFGSGGARTATGTVGITVTAVNDAPELVSLNSLLLEEGGNQTITNTLLRTTDVDNTAAQVVYTLTTLPTSGSLRLQTGGAFTTIGLNGTFTQADINAGRLNYINNGSENVSDSFSFQVSDGQIVLPESAFNINIIPVDDVPVLSVNAPLTVSEGNQGTIVNTLLQFTDNDNTSDQLVYSITSAPINGILRLGGTDLTRGSSFTQEQLNSGLLTYQHNGSETTADSFNFSLGDGTSSVQGSYNINVIPVNDAPTTSTPIGTLTVSEGATIPVLNTILNTTDPDNTSAQIVYTLTGVPVFGTLLLNNATTLASGATFTQAQINSGAITYRNNGSEAPTDVFSFNVSDGIAPSTPGIVNISVNPVNDAPVLVTNTGLTLPAGTPTSRAISSSQLLATDVDNTIDQIRYRLTVLPSAGTLRLGTGPNPPALAVGQIFTQQDIRDGRVIYQYSGTGASDGFQFALADASGGAGGTGFFRISFTS